MSRQRGRQQKSHGGNAGGGGGGGNRQGKISYNAGDEPSFIRKFKERTGYQAPLTAEDKRQAANDRDERPRDGDYRKDDEKPQIVQLNANDLTKEEVEIEIAKVKEAEDEKKCIDSSGRLLFRKPKEKSDDTDSTPVKSDIIEMASNKNAKRKNPTITTQKDVDLGNPNETTKKTKTQLLSFMDESGFDGDD